MPKEELKDQRCPVTMTARQKARIKKYLDETTGEPMAQFLLRMGLQQVSAYEERKAQKHTA